MGLMSRYADRLPFAPGDPVISLEEGSTPLVLAERLSERVQAEVWLKVEGANPTGSFKDRGMTCAVSDAHISRGISASAPRSMYSATNLLVASPSPKSNNAKCPMMAQASISTPKRSVPSPWINTGIAKMATTSGSAVPTKFHKVLRAMEAPRVMLAEISWGRSTSRRTGAPRSRGIQGYSSRRAPIQAPR